MNAVNQRKALDRNECGGSKKSGESKEMRSIKAAVNQKKSGGSKESGESEEMRWVKAKR